MTRIHTLSLGLLLLPFAAGCASQQVLEDYENELALLREERASLKRELRDARGDMTDLEVALADANAELLARPETLSYPELDSLGLDYGLRGGNMVISLPSEITFPSGSAELSKQGREALKAVARRLSSDHGDGVYYVEGHTDNDPIRKSQFESNRSLSVARAMAVLHYLVEDCDVPDEQCVVAGYGQYAPVAPNDNRGNKAKNRRVEIVVHATAGS